MKRAGRSMRAFPPLVLLIPSSRIGGHLGAGLVARLGKESIS